MRAKRFGSAVFYVLLLGGTILSSRNAWSQADQRRDLERMRQQPGTSLQQLMELEARAAARSLPVLPLEEPLDPHTYTLGPNDVVNVGVWGGTRLSYQLTVSPEGKLLVPEVGEFHVLGKTLERVKQEVSEEIRRQYKLANPTVSLISPRQFIVTVLGSVRNPGPYILSSAYRVDKAITVANILTTQEASILGQAATTGVLPKPPDLSRRRVVLRRNGNGVDQLLDLDRFYVLRTEQDNPFLREGDLIIVPPRNVEQMSVSVYGAVNAPNQYEYREYDSLWYMIRVAQGLTANADPTNVEITRLTPDASRATSFLVNLQDIIDGVKPDIPLQPRDRIVVREKTDRRKDFKAHVRGEVKYPGMYPITADSTRLSELIRRAGGFTEYAYLPGAEIFRKRLSPEGEFVSVPQEALLNLRMNDLIVTPEERAYYDLEANIQRGNVSADFVKLFNGGDQTQDVIIKDGDVIFIPNVNKTVYVYGQVGKPGYVAHHDGADVRYYIQKAGGYGEEADAGNTRVIKAKTREWKHPSDTTIEPGDYIWVPKDVKYPFAYYMSIASQAASLASVVLSMTLIILQLTH